MTQWYDAFGNGNVELGTCWQTQAPGFHIYRALSARAGGRYINWIRGDNVASAGATKRISHVLPNAADLSISVEWKFLYRFHDALNTIYFWLFVNDSTLNPAVAGINGYHLYISPPDAGGRMRLRRLDGGGGIVNIINIAFAPDTDEHEIVVTREVSGANRFWRVYMDQALVGGPTNEATYGPPTGLYYGISADDRDQLGEILISS